MGKRKTTGGEEHEVTTGWRRVMCYLQNHSGAAKVKRGIRRRERRTYWQNNWQEAAPIPDVIEEYEVAIEGKHGYLVVDWWMVTYGPDPEDDDYDMGAYAWPLPYTTETKEDHNEY